MVRSLLHALIATSPAPSFSGASRRTAWMLVFLAAMVQAAGLRGYGTPLGPGARLERVEVGAQVYQNVHVRQVTPRTVVILHDGGLSSLLLRELPMDLQARFGYDPVAEQEAELQLEHERQAVAARLANQREALQRSRRTTTSFEQLLLDMTEQPALEREVDLRPRFTALGVKDQGRRPSCSVFAVVSA